MAAPCGHDHHTSTYTPGERADLDLVLGFNRRLAAAIDAGRDVSAVEALLDPDPLRYMWVDEGGGQLPRFMEAAEEALRAAPERPGHTRLGSLALGVAGDASGLAGRAPGLAGSADRPAVAAADDGRVLHVWLEWEQGRGDHVVALLLPGRDAAGAPVRLTAQAADCFRPTALFDRAGRPWVCYARTVDGRVSVWAQRHEDGAWSGPEPVSATDHPSFNQEMAAHADGSVEVVWQGRVGGRFQIFSRQWRAGAWGVPVVVSEDPALGADNVWDPAVAALPHGGAAYAWTQYTAGSYRVVVRRAGPTGQLSASQAVTVGTDYALHPALAVTSDGSLWCAFDSVTVHGHGGSGPTRLRPLEEVAVGHRLPGMRDAGAFVPPELLPELSAAVRVVRVDADGIHVAAGDLGGGLDVTPAATPRLAADGTGGLTVAYRIHRRLPLMTFYWEVAAQTLGPGGWSPPVTFRGSDGPAEEPAVAGLPGGALVTWQTDSRLDRALDWTEGFGGRACPHLAEHHGEVIWHAVHRTGAIRGGFVPGPGRAGRGAPIGQLRSSARAEARSWIGEPDTSRHSITVDGAQYTLYWGDLHRHSLISRCTSGDEPTVEDFYRYSWDVCEYDFWALTDHAENSSEYQWWGIQKVADLFRVDGRFVPLYGFEWTGGTGHQNVIYGSARRGAPIFSAYAEGSQTPAQLWAGLREHPEYPAITIPHHPGSAMVPFDWSYHDDEFVRVVEIFQACRGNYEDDGCYRQYADGTLPGTFVLDGLRRGHRFGFIASSDHGNGASFLGAYADRLDRDGVFGALHARRVFAATTRGLLVEAWANGVFMGGQARSAGPVELEVYARGHRDLARIDLVRDGAVIATTVPELDLPAGWLTLPLRVEWGGGAATVDWSGQLRVHGGQVLQTPYWSPEVVAVTADQVSWSAQTRDFGAPYGAQRGGIELTVLAPPGAQVELRTKHGGMTLDAAKLAGRAHDVTVSAPGHLRLQPGAGGLTSLGAPEHRVRHTDDPAGPGWYYARVYQVDGEMAWSSPIWIDR